MIDANTRAEGTYQMEGNRVAINITGACNYSGIINDSTITGHGQDNTRTWDFSVGQVK